MKMIEVILSRGSRPGRFHALLEGKIIVRNSRDPEHDAARELVRHGIGGLMVTRWQGSAHLASRPRDIAAVACSLTTEDRTGLRRMKWKPFPEAGRPARKAGRSRPTTSTQPE